MGDSRPRLLVLTSTYPRWAGDPEPGFVHELARRLVGRFQVTVVCPHAAGAATREDMDGVHVVRYRYAPERWETLVNDGGIVANLRRSRWKLLLLPGFVLAQLWAAWRVCRREGVDVVHAHWLVPQGLVAVTLRMLGRGRPPFVVTSHGADLYALKGRVFDWIKAAVARRAAAVTVVSSTMAESLHRLGVPPEGVSVQSMGVDVAERFTPDPSVSRTDHEILFVGRLVEKKGLRYLLDAMPRVLQAMPDARLNIAGFGPEEAALRAQAVRLGIGDRVQFLGAVPQADLPGLYRRAALFVAPFVRAASGDQEGLGLVVVEAIACGCPVVAGDVPAVRDVLGDAPGTMVRADDVDALAEAVIAVLADPASAHAQAARLRHSLMARMDWDVVADGYGRLLANCLPPDARHG